MSREVAVHNHKSLRTMGRKLLPACVLALLVALALPGSAEDRAVKSRVAPVYPELARRMKIGGVVRLEVTVDAAGKVIAVKTLTGNHMLSVAAEDAVHKWQFEPGTGPSTLVIAIDFSDGN